MPLDSLQRPAPTHGPGLFAAITLAAAIVGGINWGLVGIFDFDLVAFLFGEGTRLTALAYAVVGIVSVLAAFALASLAGRHERHT